MGTVATIVLCFAVVWLFLLWAFVNDVFDPVPDDEEVPVVRCKDCAVPHNRWTGCPKMNGTVMPPEGFCSYGERRE